MTVRVSAVDARRSLGKLLNLVSLANEDVVIERDGKSVARLTSCAPERKTTRGQGKLDFRGSRGMGREMWRKVNVDDYLSREREEWV